MRIAWFSTVALHSEKGALLKASYLTAELLPILSQNAEIVLFAPQQSKVAFGKVTAAEHYLTAAKLHKGKPFDFFFYNIEDQKESNFSRVHCGLMPGIILFHDLLFMTVLPDAMALSPWSETLHEMTSFDNRGVDREDPFAYREASLALIALFTNPWQHGEYKRRIKKGLADRFFGGQHSFYLPTPFEPSAKNAKKTEQVFTIAYAGSQKIEDRSHKLLQALAMLKIPHQLIWMIAPSERHEAEQQLEEFSVKNVKFIEDRSVASWEKIVSEADVAVHTRRTVYGSLEPLLTVTNALEIPALVIDYAEGAYVADQGVIKIVPGNGEVSAFLAALEGIAKLENETKYPREYCSPRIVAAELLSIFSRFEAEIKDFYNAWKKFEEKNARQLKNSVKGALGEQLSKFALLGPEI
jgi:hypothetical protein